MSSKPPRQATHQLKYRLSHTPAYKPIRRSHATQPRGNLLLNPPCCLRSRPPPANTFPKLPYLSSSCTGSNRELLDASVRQPPCHHLNTDQAPPVRRGGTQVVGSQFLQTLCHNSRYINRSKSKIFTNTKYSDTERCPTPSRLSRGSAPLLSSNDFW